MYTLTHAGLICSQNGTHLWGGFVREWVCMLSRRDQYYTVCVCVFSIVLSLCVGESSGLVISTDSSLQLYNTLSLILLNKHFPSNGLEIQNVNFFWNVNSSREAVINCRCGRWFRRGLKGSYPTLLNISFLKYSKLAKVFTERYLPDYFMHLFDLNRLFLLQW